MNKQSFLFPNYHYSPLSKFKTLKTYPKFKISSTWFISENEVIINMLIIIHFWTQINFKLLTLSPRVTRTNCIQLTRTRTFFLLPVCCALWLLFYFNPVYPIFFQIPLPCFWGRKFWNLKTVWKWEILNFVPNNTSNFYLYMYISGNAAMRFFYAWIYTHTICILTC